MPDFDTSNVQGEDQVEITDLDSEVDGSSASVSIFLLRFARKLTLFNDPQSRFTLIIYLMCAVMLLFMIQPGLPANPKQTSGTSVHELHYPLAVYPFTIKNTSPAHNVTWIRISNGRVIVVQFTPGSNAWYNCKVQRSFSPPKYTHATFVICT